MNEVPVLRTMSQKQLADELRRYGFPNSPKKIKQMVKAGLLPFIDAFDGKYIIWRKGFEEWAAEHSVKETPI